MKEMRIKSSRILCVTAKAFHTLRLSVSSSLLHHIQKNNKLLMNLSHAKWNAAFFTVHISSTYSSNFWKRRENSLKQDRLIRYTNRKSSTNTLSSLSYKTITIITTKCCSTACFTSLGQQQIQLFVESVTFFLFRLPCLWNLFINPLKTFYS